MPTFDDLDGNRWTIVLDLALAKQLRAEGFDIFDEKRFAEITGDIITQVDFLYLICKPQADERKITDADFGRLITGCYENATEALHQELEHFFRQLGLKMQAQIAAKTLRAYRRAQTVGAEKLTGPKLDKAIEREIQKAEAKIDRALTKLGEESTSSPEPPELPPDPSPSAN